MKDIIKNKENSLNSSINNMTTSIVGSLARLHNPNSITIDSINTDGTITGRYLDGEVVTFNNKNLDPYYEEVLDSETNKTYRKLKLQTVSQFTQKPEDQITEKDYNNVANFLQQQTVSHIFRENNNNNTIDKSIFEANLDLNENSELNTTVDINGQNITIPINSSNQPDKNINRYKELLQKDSSLLSETELSEKKAIEQIAINDAIEAQNKSDIYNTNKLYNELNSSNLNLKATLNPDGSYLPYTNHIKVTPRVVHEMTTGEYWSTFARKSVAEGIAAVSTGLLGLFNYYENEQEREGHKGDITSAVGEKLGLGHVPLSYQIAEQQAVEKAMDAIKRGDLLEAAWHAKFQILPEIAQEAGELLVTALAMGAVTVATGGIGGGAAAAITGAKLSKALAKANNIGLKLSKYIVAPVAVSSDQYLTGVANYEANNGEPMSLARRAVYMAGLSATNAVDLAMIKEAGKIALGTANKAVNGITDPIKKKMAKKALARYATATLAGGVGEGLQEYVQTIFDTNMTQNQADGKTLIEIALDPNTQFSALMGTLVGGSVGAGATLVGDALSKSTQNNNNYNSNNTEFKTVPNTRAEIKSSKDIMQGFSNIEIFINSANSEDDLSNAEQLISQFKQKIDEDLDTNYTEEDIEKINSLEAKLALRKETLSNNSVSLENYAKNSSSFVKSFILDFNNAVNSWVMEDDEKASQAKADFINENKGKIKSLKKFIQNGRIIVDKETKASLSSIENTLNKFSQNYIENAKEDDSFIEDLLDDKEDRFFYMYDNANKVQKEKLIKIAIKDTDLKRLLAVDKHGNIDIKKSLASVKKETTIGAHGTRTYSRAINFYNKKLITLENKAKNEQLTPKEIEKKSYFENKINSYKDTILNFLNSQVNKLSSFAEIYTNPTAEKVSYIDKETGKEKEGTIAGVYASTDPSTGDYTEFQVNIGDLHKSPNNSGSGKVISETISNIQRLYKITKKRSIPSNIKQEIKELVQEANTYIDKINNVLSKNSEITDFHENIQVGNKRKATEINNEKNNKQEKKEQTKPKQTKNKKTTESITTEIEKDTQQSKNTYSEATELSVNEDNKKQVENTTKKENIVTETKNEVLKEEQTKANSEQKENDEKQTTEKNTPLETVESSQNEDNISSDELTRMDETTTSDDSSSKYSTYNSDASTGSIEASETKKENSSSITVNNTTNDTKYDLDEPRSLFVENQKIEEDLLLLSNDISIFDSLVNDPYEIENNQEQIKELYEKIFTELNKSDIPHNLPLPKDFDNIKNFESIFDTVINNVNKKIENWKKREKLLYSNNPYFSFLPVEEIEKQNLVEYLQEPEAIVNPRNSIFSFSIPRKIVLKINGKPITFNSANHAIASLIHNKSNDLDEWTLNNEEYKKEKWYNNKKEHLLENSFSYYFKNNNIDLIIMLIMQDLFFKDNNFRKSLIKLIGKKINIPTEQRQLYFDKQGKFEEINRKLAQYDIDNEPFPESLIQERKELLEFLEKLENEPNFTIYGITYFLDVQNVNNNLKDINENFKKNNSVLFFNTVTQSNEIITYKENGYSIQDLNSFGKKEKEVFNLLFFNNGQTVEQRLSKWKRITRQLDIKNSFNSNTNTATTTYTNKQNELVFKIETKQTNTGEFEYTLVFSTGFSQTFNSHPLLATKNKYHSLISRDILRKNIINEKDEKYGIQDLRKKIDSNKELIGNIKSIYHILQFFKNNYDVLAKNTLANKIKIIDKTLKNKIENITDDNENIIDNNENPLNDLKNIITDFDKLLNSSKSINDDIIKNFLEKNLNFLGETIDKLLIDNKTIESKIKVIYKNKNAEQEKNKTINNVWNSIKNAIKEKYKNEYSELILHTIDLQNQFNENPENFIANLETTYKEKQENVQKLQQKNTTKTKTSLMSDITNEILDISIIEQIKRELIKKIGIPNDIKELTNKEEKQKAINEYLENSFLDTTIINEIFDDYIFKTLMGSLTLTDQDTSESLISKEYGDFIVAFKPKESTTILPTSNMFSRKNKEIKEILKNLFNTTNKNIINKNAAYFLLDSVHNFPLAIDYAVAELFYTNPKIFNDSSVYMGTIIEDLGKSVLNALGLQLNKSTVAYRLENQILQDIGYLALNYAENMGYLETKTAIINQKQTNIITNKTNEYDRDILNHKYELLIKKQKRKSGTYSFKKEVLPERREKNPESKELQQANKKLMNTPFRINYEAIELIEKNRYNVQKALGWMTQEEINQLPTKDLKDSQKGINEQIEKSINELVELKKEVDSMDEKPKYIYFNTFSATNTRMHIDSSTINPQNDKLHRFLFPPVSTEDNLLEEIVIKNDEESEKLKQQFMYAIGQGLGLDVDKVTNNKRFEWFEIVKENLISDKKIIEELKDALLTNNKTEIKRIESIINLPIKTDEFSHFLQVLLVLENTDINENNEVIINSKGVQYLTVEHDSASSGVVIRALASSVFTIEDDKTKEINKAVGLYTSYDTPVDSRNAFFNDENAVDVYQTAAVDLNSEEISKDNNINQLKADGFRAGYKGIQIVKNQTQFKSVLPFVDVSVTLETDKKGKKHKIANFKSDERINIYNSLKSFLGFSVSKKVSKKLRKFMKSLVMPFNYQMGFNGTLETATRESINDIMLELITTDDPKKIKDRDDFLDYILQYFSGIEGNLYGVNTNGIKITNNMTEEQKIKAKSLFLELIKHVNYEHIKFTVFAAVAEPYPVNEKLNSDIEYKYTDKLNQLTISFFDLIQHTVMYMYAGTLYGNLREKFSTVRGSAVFNSLVNPFLAQHRIKTLEKNGYVYVERNDDDAIKNLTFLNLKKLDKGEIVEQIQEKDGSTKVIYQKLGSTDKNEYLLNKEEYIEKNSDGTHSIVYSSPLFDYSIKKANKILQGTELGLTGLPIHSSNEIYLNTISVKLEKTNDSSKVFKTGIKTEMPINYQGDNLMFSKIQAQNKTIKESNVTKALSVPLDINIQGSSPTLAAVTIHNLDSEIMAYTVNNNVGQVLPVFDAIVSSPFAVNDSSKALNEGIYEISMKTSIEDRSLLALNQINELDTIKINTAEAQLIDVFLKKMGIDEDKRNSFFKREVNKIGKFTNNIIIDLEKYKNMLQEISVKIKNNKEKYKKDIIVANVDGIDNTAYNPAKPKEPKYRLRTDNDVLGYLYTQGSEEDKDDSENIMFSDGDLKARINLYDTLLGDVEDTTGWFTQVKEWLQTLGSLRLGTLGVTLVEKSIDTLEKSTDTHYSKSKHKITLERSTVANLIDKYKHPAIQYAHELIHAVLVTALSNAKDLGISKELNQLFDLYDLAYQHLTVEDFLPSYYTNEDEALTEAKKVYDYIFGAKLKDETGLVGLNEFIAYALTDERLARKLQSILVQKQSEKKKTLWDRIVEIVKTIFNISKPEENKNLDGLMNNLVDLFKSNKDINAFESLQHLVQKIVEADNKAMQRAEEQNPLSGIKKLIYTAGEKAIIPANKTISGFIQKVLTLTDNPEYYDKLVKNIHDPNGNLLIQMKGLAKILLNVFTSSQARKKLPQVLQYIGLNTFASYNFVGRWIDEMKEADEYKRIIEDMGRASRKIDQNAQGMKNIVISQLAEIFKDDNRPNGLTEEEKAMLTNSVLKLDLSCLKGNKDEKSEPITAKELQNLLIDDKETDELINTLQDKLEVLLSKVKFNDESKILIKNKINMLVDYIVNGNVYANCPTNVNTMVKNMVSDMYWREQTPIIDTIDQLVSALAIKQIPFVHRQTIASMNTEGLDKFLNIHRITKRNTYLYNGKYKSNASKGYDSLSKGFVKTVSNNHHEVVIGFADQEEFYAQKGFKPMPDISAGKIKDKELVYYKDGFKAVNSRNGAAYVYSGFDHIGQSVFLLAENELKFGQTNIELTNSITQTQKVSILRDSFIHDIKKHSKEMDDKLSKNELSIKDIQDLNKNYQNVYPIYNATNHIIDYKIIPPKESRKQLSITDDAFILLGEMTATDTRREQGDQLNYELLNYIFTESNKFISNNLTPDEYAINHDKDGNRWIPITPDSFDSFARQVWEESDSFFKQYITKHMKTTNKPVYIREDVLLDVFGQKDIVIANIISRNLPVVRQAIQLFGMIAKFISTEYKSLVIIKTPQVLIGNILSNIVLAIVQGINPVDIIKSYVTDFKAIQDYDKTYKKIKELQLKLKETQVEAFNYDKIKSIENELEILENKRKNNPVHDLMEAGYKQSIVEDINNIEFDNSSYFDSKIEKFRKTLPNPLVSTFDILFMTKRTAGYQFIHKMTSYSDLLARSVEYKHKLKKIETKYKKGTEEYNLAIQRVKNELSDNYINYDKPHSAVEQWLNDIGLLLFTKFFKRIQSVIFKLGIKNPLGTAAFLTANTALGAPNIFETSILVKDLTTYTHNPVDFIEELITPPLLNILSNDNKMNSE